MSDRSNPFEGLMTAADKDRYAAWLRVLYLHGRVGCLDLAARYGAELGVTQSSLGNSPLQERLSFVEAAGRLDFDRIEHGDALYRYLVHPSPAPLPAGPYVLPSPYYYVVPNVGIPDDDDYVMTLACPDEIADAFSVVRYTDGMPDVVVTLDSRAAADEVTKAMNTSLLTLHLRGDAVIVFPAADLRGADREAVKAAMERAGQEAISNAGKAIIFRGPGA